MANTPITADLPAIQWIGSIEYSIRRLTLATEYAREYLKIETASPLYPQASLVSEQYYLMANYQLTDSFAPGAYYSLYTPNIAARGGHEKMQGDLAIYCRYDFNPHWLLKVEGHLLNGTAALDPALNNGQPLSSLNDNWQSIVFKTTISF
jgi:hypothetical protein